MQKEPTYYRDLLSDFINDRLAPERLDELLDYAQADPQGYVSLLALPEIGELLEQKANDEGIPVAATLSSRMKQRLMEAIEQRKGPVTHKVHFLKKPVARWMAAASVAVLAGIGGYFLFFNHAPGAGDHTSAAVVHDVAAPQTSRAAITLSNGQKVFLDSTGNGTLATQNNISITKTGDGIIRYSETPSPRGDLPELTGQAGEAGGEAYNTLTNPRGSKVINMTLSDGSQVWLNAGSSITYPVAFTGNERKVTMTGEAYFEIAHRSTAGGSKQSFIVEKGEMRVTVLGTHFNVNAYDDESDIKVTLLEGSVKVSRAAESVMLEPGQQARLTRNLEPETLNHIDLEQVIAWKNNLFDFRGDKIQAVMRQIARWYDVDVQYRGNITNEDFVGSISRLQNVSEVLKLMETTRKVRFEIDGRKIIVTPP